VTSNLRFFSPELDREFESAAPAARRRAVLAALLAAVRETGLNSPIVEIGLRLIGSGQWESAETSRELGTLASELEETYWAGVAPYEDMPVVPDELVAPFKPALLRSNAARALSYALSGSDSDLQTSLQEALEAREGTREAIDETRQELRAFSSEGH
jgi:hypothetical protein